MDNICPYFRTSEEKHSIDMCFAMEHMTNCKSRIRVCDVPRCAFLGNKKDMEAHHEEDVVRHNALLARAHRELIEDVKNKPEEAGKDYAKEVVSMWSKSWKIEKFPLYARQASSQDIPLTSGNFRKNDQVWRLLFFPSDNEIFLQLMSSQELQHIKATIAVQDCGYSFPAVVLKENDMVGGKLDDSNKYHEVEVKVVVTTYEYRKQITSYIQKEPTAHEFEVGTEMSSSMKVALFVDDLERSRTIKRIIAKAKEVSQRLPKDLGKGKSGGSSFNALDKEVREIFQARLDAPESLATLIDDIVLGRYTGQLYYEKKSMIDDFYEGNSIDNADTRTASLKSFGNISLFVSGAIIKLLKEKNVV